VALHVAHRPVPAQGEPTVQVAFVSVEVGRRDPDFAEAELQAEPLDVGGQLLELWGA
jgi:hypothetical protein